MNAIHQPVLIVIAGPNGSGKTTVTEQILRHEWMEGAEYINPDRIAKDKFGDWNSEEAVRKSILYCEERREKCIRERRSLIFETVLSRDDKIEYIEKAKKAGFFVRLFFVCTASPTINAARIAKRVMEGGHNVPIPKINSRYKKSIANCCIAAKIVDRCYIYDNSADGCDARLLFRASDGVLAKKYIAEIPAWAEFIYQSVAR
ncbi:zeta toxin family protein [uncultured Alistipes sp.]|uniref:zeta toxin family protein n=1 Tax=uncultured Alistipes sp. TaxID=538949 RepID=UPI0025AA038B|nr:zeta toxin family protein [uncultured Alistipes sp.]